MNPFGLFDWLKIGLGVLVGALLAYQVGKRVGDGIGYERAQAENRQAHFDQIKERMETDEEVQDMDDAGLCALLGGVYRNGACH